MMLLIYIKIFLLFINIGFTYSIQIVKYISEITKFNQNGVLKVVRKPVEFEHYFHPVSQKWKVETRKKFQLDFNKFSFEVVRDDNLTKLLNTPYEKCVAEIKKENCLYRALSILLCGDERYQRYLRHLIFEYIRENRQYLEKILGKYKIEDYLWYHFSINPGVTIIPDDIELYAAATFLNVGIYKYDYDTKEWDFYHKDLPDYISLRKSQFEFRVIADKLSDSVSEKKSKKVIKKTAEIESNMVYLNESEKLQQNEFQSCLEIKPEVTLNKVINKKETEKTSKKESVKTTETVKRAMEDEPNNGTENDTINIKEKITNIISLIKSKICDKKDETLKLDLLRDQCIYLAQSKKGFYLVYYVDDTIVVENV